MGDNARRLLWSTRASIFLAAGPGAGRGKQKSLKPYAFTELNSGDCQVSLAQLEHALHAEAAAHAQRGRHTREEEQRALGLGRPRDGPCPCACRGGVARIEQRRASPALAELGAGAFAAEPQEQLAREAGVEPP